MRKVLFLFSQLITGRLYLFKKLLDITKSNILRQIYIRKTGKWLFAGVGTDLCLSTNLSINQKFGTVWRTKRVKTRLKMIIKNTSAYWKLVQVSSVAVKETSFQLAASKG